MTVPFAKDTGVGTERTACLAQRLQELIEAKPRAGLPIGHYAAVLRVSESRLTSHCRRQTGRSPSQIINACIVRKAREKMLAANLSTSEIAFSLGFRHPAYFSRFFRLQTGQTPTEFRAAARDGGDYRAAAARPDVTACADRR